MRLATALLMALLLVSGTVFAAAPSDDPGEPAGSWTLLWQKADPDLRERLISGQTEALPVILTGPTHRGLPQEGFPDRAAAMEHLDRQAAPFFQAVETLTQRHGGEVLGAWSAAPAIKVQGGEELFRLLAALPEVQHMAFDHDEALSLVQAPGVDPRSGDELGAQNTQGGQMIQAQEIWDAGFQGEGVRVSVIDTGIDPGHEAFRFADGSSRIVAWADCTSNCNQAGTPYDDHGHGTHVAGTVAGSDVYDDPEWGTFQEQGVAPKAELMGAKFLDQTGGGSFQGGMDAIQWSFDNDADLTVNSWGGSCSAAASVIALVNQLNDLGMVNVFAAGNDGSLSDAINGPGCAKSAIAIGAVDASENIASFSSRGPCSDPTQNEDDRICPHVVAKGVNVRSAFPRSSPSDSGYAFMSGTSMSTPMVAGAVALMIEMKRHFHAEEWDTAGLEERQMLMHTAKPLGASSPNNDYGWGLVQLKPILDSFSQDGSDILSDFEVSEHELRTDETAELVFSVRNVGHAQANGTLRATLISPDGQKEVLVNETVTLGLFDRAQLTRSFVADEARDPGAYRFQASFDYTWTNDTGEQSGFIEHEAGFMVFNTWLEFELIGLDAHSLPALPQELEFTLTAHGNEPASWTRLEFSVPHRYMFLPGDNWDPLHDESRYADPAPSQVESGLDENRAVLVWHPGELAPGESFSFTTSVAATLATNFTFHARATFEDGAEQTHSHHESYHQHVGL